jgi:hypothetical protein
VYDDLASLLAVPAPSTVPGEPVPHVLAVAAAYSYAADLGTLATMMTRLGLAGASCYAVSEEVDGMLIDARAALVQSPGGEVVVLAFRGTPPTSAISWLVDGDTSPSDVVLRSLAGQAGSLPRFQVHAGFYRNVRAIRWAVMAALRRALEGRSVDPGEDRPTGRMQRLYVTGHSLGGAMAALFTIMLLTDAQNEDVADALGATCTYGQPMVGTRAFAVEVGRRQLDTRLVRYLYRHDPVPQCPPRFTGDYAHVGAEWRFDTTWSQSSQPIGQVRNPLELAVLPESALLRRTTLRRLPWGGLSADDHGPQNYVTCLTPAGTANEFGDDVFAP